MCRVEEESSESSRMKSVGVAVVCALCADAPQYDIPCYEASAWSTVIGLSVHPTVEVFVWRQALEAVIFAEAEHWLTMLSQLPH